MSVLSRPCFHLHRSETVFPALRDAAVTPYRDNWVISGAVPSTTQEGRTTNEISALRGHRDGFDAAGLSCRMGRPGDWRAAGRPENLGHARTGHAGSPPGPRSGLTSTR